MRRSTALSRCGASASCRGTERNSTNYMLYRLCVCFTLMVTNSMQKNTELMNERREKSRLHSKANNDCGSAIERKSKRKYARKRRERVCASSEQNEMVNNSDRVQLFHTWVNAIVCDRLCRTKPMHVYGFTSYFRINTRIHLTCAPWSCLDASIRNVHAFDCHQ